MVKTIHGQYDAYNLEVVWQSLFKCDNQVLKALGGHDLDIGHTRAGRGSVRDLVPIEMATYDAAFNWRIDGEDGSNEERK